MLAFRSVYSETGIDESVISRAVRETALTLDWPDRGIGMDGKPRRTTPHSLRRTYSTVLHDANVPPKVVDSVTGHASAGITLSVYTSVTSDGVERARRAVEEAWDRAADKQSDPILVNSLSIRPPRTQLYRL